MLDKYANMNNFPIFNKSGLVSADMLISFLTLSVNVWIRRVGEILSNLSSGGGQRKSGILVRRDCQIIYCVGFFEPNNVVDKCHVTLLLPSKGPIQYKIVYGKLNYQKGVLRVLDLVAVDSSFLLPSQLTK